MVIFEAEAKYENAAVPVRFTNDLPVRSNHGRIGWTDFLGTGDEHEIATGRRERRMPVAIRPESESRCQGHRRRNAATKKQSATDRRPPSITA